MKKVAPRYTSLHVRTGYVCNNDCVFCCDPVGDRPMRLQAEAARAQLVENVHLGTVVFTSHEPTLNRELVQWVGWAAELGYETITLVTNGRRLAKDGLAARLVDAGLTTVDVSVHGHTAALHDAITRRSGSFDEAVAGIEAVRQLRAQRELQLKILSTVIRLNVDHLPEMTEFAFGFEPDAYGLNAVFLSGLAATHLEEVAVEYDRMVASFARCLPAEGHRNVALSEVPPCRTHGRIPPAYVGFREEFHFVDIDGDGNCLHSPRAVAPPGRGFTYRAACDRCGYRPLCDGVPEPYLERYGWDGFDPVDPAAVAAAMAEADGGNAPPFVAVDRLRRLLTPPRGQWTVASLEVGLSEAQALLSASPPRDVEVALVLTPRDETANAFRRTAEFNVAIGGQGATRAQEALADAAARWLRKQEQRPR